MPVINVSLVGPKNLMLQRAVEALSARGQLIVAKAANLQHGWSSVRGTSFAAAAVAAQRLLRPR